MCCTESFCCCISLEVGTQVISIVCTLMSAVVTILYGSAAVFLKRSQTKFLFYLAMAVAAGLQCVFGAVLSFGAFQRRPRSMWPWLVLTWFTSGALLLLSLGGFILLVIGGQLSGEANFIISAYVLYSLFQIYCACVVNSRRVELIKELESEPSRTLMRHPTAWKYV